MSDVATFLLVSLSVAGLCLSTLLLSFPLHKQVLRARICIDSKESIPPEYVARRAGTTNRGIVIARQATKAGRIDSFGFLKV
jgi:hypothetical protein